MATDPEIVNKCLDEIDRLKARINMLECMAEAYGADEDEFKCYFANSCATKCEIKHKT